MNAADVMEKNFDNFINGKFEANALLLQKLRIRNAEFSPAELIQLYLKFSNVVKVILLHCMLRFLFYEIKLMSHVEYTSSY